MSRVSSFRQRDFEKALAAARKACGSRFTAEIAPDGAIRFEFGAAPAAVAAGSPASDFDRWEAETGGRS